MNAITIIDPREAFPAYLGMSGEDFDFLHGAKPEFKSKDEAEDPSPVPKVSPFRSSRRRGMFSSRQKRSD